MPQKWKCLLFPSGIIMSLISPVPQEHPPLLSDPQPFNICPLALRTSPSLDSFSWGPTSMSAQMLLNVPLPL